MERLDKIIANRGVATRREVKELVRQGRVLVNGIPAASPEQKFSMESDVITVDGIAVTAERYCYLLLHKPAGVLSATEDSRQPMVLDLLPPEQRRHGLSPVGRLDKDTEGLLLITNDGDLAHQLLSPKKHVDKVYRARIEGQVTAEDAALFAKGMEIDDEDGAWRAMPAKLNILSSGPESELEITIREGKFHQIKRMFEAVDKKVVYLKRLSMGSLRLDETLALGEYRELTEDEVQALKESKGHTNDEE